MNQRDWFQMVEQEKPGLLRKVWEDYLCSTKREDDQLIARDLTIHARMRGDDVVITIAGWRHYRTNNGLVSYHRQKQIEEPPPAIGFVMGDEPSPQRSVQFHFTQSLQAIAALEGVILFLKNCGGVGYTPAPEQEIRNAIDTLFRTD